LFINKANKNLRVLLYFYERKAKITSLGKLWVLHGKSRAFAIKAFLKLVEWSGGALGPLYSLTIFFFV
jgi:hypothetical protein